MNLRRLKQVCLYGWKDAAIISQEEGVNKNKWIIFCDMLLCYFKYNVWTNQYKKEELYTLTGEARKEICLKYQEKNTYRDKWVKEFFDNYKFLKKWSSFKYETSAQKQAKRRAAYKKKYGLGDNCFIGYDVIFHRHHYADGIIKSGNNCLIAEHTNIDYTGGLTIGNKVSISEGVKILTHNHVSDFSGNDETKGSIQTPLIIGDRVWIGTRCTILPGVIEIGRGALIAANTCINKKVPPYAIVMGNPAKIVGFRLRPEKILKFEEDNYPENERIPIGVLKDNYNKYFRNRWKEIRDWDNY
jgi:acetyltransferase-like isoleucine patch superfamily enzyme